MAYIKICMAASLLLTFARASVLVLLSLPQVLLQSIIMHVESAKGVVFYEGTIRHVRRKPVYNAFTYAASANLFAGYQHRNADILMLHTDTL